jgi:hypothetical protein
VITAWRAAHIVGGRLECPVHLGVGRLDEGAPVGGDNGGDTAIALLNPTDDSVGRLVAFDAL